MSVISFKISTRVPATQVIKAFQSATGKQTVVNRIARYILSTGTGTKLGPVGGPPAIQIRCQDSEAVASGTLTLATVIATNTCSINGVTFTAVASGATGNQFNVGGTDIITAANLAAAINASVTALVQGYVTATSSGAVVTVSSAFYGLSGNQTLLVGSATITASSAKLTGGTADPGLTTLNF